MRKNPDMIYLQNNEYKYNIQQQTTTTYLHALGFRQAHSEYNRLHLFRVPNPFHNLGQLCNRITQERNKTINEIKIKEQRQNHSFYLKCNVMKENSCILSEMDVLQKFLSLLIQKII